MELAAKKHYRIETSRLCLKPYTKDCVPQYHSWFQLDPELLYLTGSEPLTLQEELQNQQSWMNDPKKYTFLIFTKEGQMIGDVNLFFSTWVEEFQAEINIMIAVKQHRGKGYAKEVLEAVEFFAHFYYKKTEIIAKIKDDNSSSRKLFEGMKYKLVNHSQHFQEFQFRKQLHPEKNFEVHEVSQISLHD